jgi:hypothetical protein
MSDQVIGQPDVRSPALAEPAQHVRYRWIVGLTLASLGDVDGGPDAAAGHAGAPAAGHHAPTLFAATALVAIAASAGVWKIKSVR